MALLGKVKSILSCLQMEAYGADINDRSCSIPGGKHHILVDGYQFPLDFKNGIPYLRCRKPTEAELSYLPHIIMTSDVNCDPKQYDITFDEIEKFHDTSQVDFEHEHFDQNGEYCHRTVATHSIVSEEEFFDALKYFEVADIVDDIIDTLRPDNVCSTYVAHLSNVTPASPNFELLRPLFGWTPADTIKRTFEVTTQ
jgi:replicative superfamily II helicase